jgi:hypothetical protein
VPDRSCAEVNWCWPHPVANEASDSQGCFRVVTDDAVLLAQGLGLENRKAAVNPASLHNCLRLQSVHLAEIVPVPQHSSFSQLRAHSLLPTAHVRGRLTVCKLLLMATVAPLLQHIRMSKATQESCKASHVPTQQGPPASDLRNLLGCCLQVAHAVLGLLVAESQRLSKDFVQRYEHACQ